MCNCQLQQDHLWAFGGKVAPNAVNFFEFQVISATLSESTVVDFWAKPREKSFGQTGKLGPFRPEGRGNLPVWGPGLFFSSPTRCHIIS